VGQERSKRVLDVHSYGRRRGSAGRERLLAIADEDLIEVRIGPYQGENTCAPWEHRFVDCGAELDRAADEALDLVLCLARSVREGHPARTQGSRQRHAGSEQGRHPELDLVAVVVPGDPMVGEPDPQVALCEALEPDTFVRNPGVALAAAKPFTEGVRRDRPTLSRVGRLRGRTPRHPWSCELVRPSRRRCRAPAACPRAPRLPDASIPGPASGAAPDGEELSLELHDRIRRVVVDSVCCEI